MKLPPSMQCRAGLIALPLLITTLLILMPFPDVLAADRQGAQAAGAPALPIKLRSDITQPYIVKKGDTLWDIANHFFEQPTKWLKLWEQNLYITNPDLIYPGNKIWFHARQTGAGKSSGLTTVRMQPTIRIKPVERLEARIDSSMVLTALARQDFIQPEDIDAAGYVLDSRDERINYGAHDHIYLKFNAPVEEDSVYDVFRKTDPIHDPVSGELAGMLVKHLGQVRITANQGGVAEGLIIRAFEEISRGDRLKPSRSISTRIIPDYPEQPLSGQIMYIRNDAAEAGQYQIVGINLGQAEGVKTGSMLRVLKAGRVVRDSVSGGKEPLPEEGIGELIVIAPQQHAAIALVSRSTGPINLGDAVRNQTRR